MYKAARLAAKNRSHGWNLLTCENFVEDFGLLSLRQFAQNPQHFLTGLDFVAF